MSPFKHQHLVVSVLPLGMGCAPSSPDSNVCTKSGEEWDEHAYTGAFAQDALDQLLDEI